MEAAAERNCGAWPMGRMVRSRCRDTVYEVTSTYVRRTRCSSAAQDAARRDQAMADVAPVVVTLFKGGRWCGAGEKITPEVMLRLEALGLTEQLGECGSALLLRGDAAAGGDVGAHTCVAAGRRRHIAMASSCSSWCSPVLVIPPLSPRTHCGIGLLTSILTRPRTALLLVSMLSIDVGPFAGGFDFFVTMVVLLTVCSLYSVSRLTYRSAHGGGCL